MGNLAIFFGPRSEVLCSVFVSLKLGVFEWRQPDGGESVRESVVSVSYSASSSGVRMKEREYVCESV